MPDANFVANPTITDIETLFLRYESVTGKRPTELRGSPATLDALVKDTMGKHYHLGIYQTLKVLGVDVVPDNEAPPGIIYAMSQ